MTLQCISLHDISPKQREITCLPFDIIDEDNELVRRLYNAVYKQHKDHANKPSILAALEERYQTVSHNRYELAQLHLLDVGAVRVQHMLTRVMPFKNKQVQVLTSDIVLPLSDGQKEFSQVPLCFFVSEDNQTWEKVVLPDERKLVQQPSDSSEDYSLEQALLAAHELQKNLPLKSKRNTTNVVSSESNTPNQD